MDEIATVASGSCKLHPPPEIKGSGYVVEALEAALWAFYHSHDFRQGCLLAVNLGNDADTTGLSTGSWRAHITARRPFRLNGEKDWRCGERSRSIHD